MFSEIRVCFSLEWYCFVLFLSLSEDKHCSVSEVSAFASLKGSFPAFLNMTFDNKLLGLFEEFFRKAHLKPLSILWWRCSGQILSEILQVYLVRIDMIVICIFPQRRIQNPVEHVRCESYS